VNFNPEAKPTPANLNAPINSDERLRNSRTMLVRVAFL